MATLILKTKTRNNRISRLILTVVNVIMKHTSVKRVKRGKYFISYTHTDTTRGISGSKIFIGGSVVSYI